MESGLFSMKRGRRQDTNTTYNHQSFSASSINRTCSAFNNIPGSRWCQRHGDGDEFCPLSYQEHIGCNFCSIQWQSAFSPITSCHLPLHTWQGEEEADCLMKRAGNKKERERERNWDPLRQIKTKRSFNGAVACTYVSLGLILWMTCRHLGVITALLLTPCSTLFSSQVFWFITLENSYRPHGGGKSTGVFSFCRVLFCVLHKTRLLTDVHLECSLEPFLFSKVTKEGPCAGLNMLLTYFHKMGTLVRETEAENAKMKDSVSKMCILAFIIRIKAFIIAHTVNGSILPRRHCAIDCIW